MRTTKDYFKEYSNLCQFEEGSPEYLVDKEDFIKALKEYALEAIKEDRQNVAKRASLIGYYEEWKDGELVMDEDNYDCNYASPYLGNGRIIVVNENSIINAPMPDLK